MLADLMRMPGWKVYEEKVKALVDAQLQQLRTCKPDGLQRVQGKVEGLEQAIRLVTVPVSIMNK
jgi:hypothetical protein